MSRPRNNRIVTGGIVALLPAGLTAKRSTAGGRTGATRWEIYDGPDQVYENWLGDLVRFLPEGIWAWQPGGGEPVERDTVFKAIAAMPRSRAFRSSHAGAPATPFCLPGAHIVDPATSWTLIRASFRDGRWISNPESPAKIVACDQHADLGATS